MTWRERIERARKVGHFTARDRALFARVGTCPVGEVTKGVTGQNRMLFASPFWIRLDTSMLDCELGKRRSFQPRIWRALWQDDVSEMSRIMDELDDNALKLKRGEEL